jgi:hypothetical protein
MTPILQDEQLGPETQSVMAIRCYQPMTGLHAWASLWSGQARGLELG